jgi:adenylate kinase family enzyme
LAFGFVTGGFKIYNNGMTPQTFIFMGRSAAGKGTQANLLIEYLKNKTPDVPIYSFESGGNLRNFYKGTDSYSARMIEDVLNKGGFLPEFVAIWNWSRRFIEDLKGGEHIIVDGSPRKQKEAEVLHGVWHFYKREFPKIIHLNASRDWCLARMKERGRADDINPDSANSRLNLFDIEVAPILEWYSEHPEYSILEINGEQTIEEVHKEIIKKAGL